MIYNCMHNKNMKKLHAPKNKKINNKKYEKITHLKK